MTAPEPIGRDQLLLLVQRALLGEVFSALRMVWLQWEPGLVRLTALVDPGISQDDKDSVTSVAAEIEADFRATIVNTFVVTSGSPPSDAVVVFARKTPG